MLAVSTCVSASERSAEDVKSEGTFSASRARQQDEHNISDVAKFAGINDTRLNFVKAGAYKARANAIFFNTSLEQSEDLFHLGTIFRSSALPNSIVFS